MRPVVMKLSRKDFLLLFGIAIAIIVVLTTAVFSETPLYQPGAGNHSQKPNRAISDLPSGFLKQAIDQIKF